MLMSRLIRAIAQARTVDELSAELYCSSSARPASLVAARTPAARMSSDIRRSSMARAKLERADENDVNSDRSILRCWNRGVLRQAPCYLRDELAEPYGVGLPDGTRLATDFWKQGR